MAAKETDLMTIKEVLKVFLDTEVKYDEDAHGNVFIRHPVYGSLHMPCQEENGEIQRLNIFQSPRNLEKAKRFMTCQIDAAKDILSIGYFLQSPYRLQFLEIIESSLALEDMALYLAAFWRWPERKTVINGVKKSKIKKWLAACDKNILMCEEDRKVFDNLKDPVTVYRGVTDESMGDLPSTITWAVNIDDAVWYARRYLAMGRERSYVYQAAVDKKDIYACIHNSRSTDALVNGRGLRDITLIDTLIHGRGG